MINIVLPIAGRGKRFSDVGYSQPKPLIPIHGKPMLAYVIDNLSPNLEHRFIFIAQRDHIDEGKLGELIEVIAPGSIVIPVNTVTEGPACSVLLAKEYIDSETEPLMIANCDQWVEFDINQYIEASIAPGVDGMIMTMKADHPKWSYAKVDKQGFVTETAEKVVISNEATVGIYNFTKGSDFVWAANEMIKKNLRVKNEFYVAPAYNELITVDKKVRIFNVGEEFNGMYGLGTPSDLEAFLELPISNKISRKLPAYC